MANENEIQATGTFVVSKGLALIAKLAAAQGELEFTKAAVGTGSPPEGYSPESMIGLNAYKMDAQIADYGVQDDMAYITVQISSDNVTEGFLCTEVGIFADDPDEGEILYGYMDISTDPTYIYANGSSNRSKFAEFTLYVSIGTVSKVIAAVTPGSIITRETFKASNMSAIDTHGLLEDEENPTAQALFDAIVNKVLTELVTNTSLTEQLGSYILKSKIVNDFLATDTETVLSGPMGKQLKKEISELNTEMPRIYQLDGAEIQSGVQIDTISAVRASLIIWGVQNGVSSPFGIIIGINPSTSPQIQFSNFGMDELTPTYSGNIVKLPVNEYSNVVIWADKEVSVSGY